MQYSLNIVALGCHLFGGVESENITAGNVLSVSGIHKVQSISYRSLLDYMATIEKLIGVILCKNKQPMNC